MRQMMMALALLGALTTGAYAQAPASEKSKGAKSTSSSASHSVEGTVKSMDSSMLTITRSGKDKGDLMVMTNASTHKDGPIAVGSTVSTVDGLLAVVLTIDITLLAALVFVSLYLLNRPVEAPTEVTPETTP